MQKPKMPPPEPVQRMPLPDDANAKAVKRRAQAALQATGGRESTELSDDNMTSYLGK